MEIEGVQIIPLKIIPDDRGQVMHVLRSTDVYFEQFAELYFSMIYPGIIKGWKLHTKSTSCLTAPVGRLKYVLHDLREGSVTKGNFQVVYLGENSYQLLIIPPGIAYGWKNLLPSSALVANCATELWSPQESQNIPFEQIKFDSW
ncbi:dTDP-4-dehydrorhamnose 3,5-epimerase [Candidatus Uhrbacteria bacterium CG_4_9_14_3_um_filter_36_7]|uniref:dTDP-4-dehydrorhamnose 3,5-epimerase n=1 Tax=Candidatus Uhrbacteria bacterium CG_4_9_14_3_um_filter_36_7 TaxID=1975033 RepID=A0A2M7XI27_9BACT|nr:MAG: dTDP-4-dehydrorhamnose 3,5-epimerase [Candidatus Uhrbacteria bacterium CG_4_9_14_3_um_filter_36_7]